jgi:hypothetical protein
LFLNLLILLTIEEKKVPKVNNNNKKPTIPVSLKISKYKL